MTVRSEEEWEKCFGIYYGKGGRRRGECERECGGGVGREEDGMRVWRKKTALRWWDRHGNGTRSGMGIWIGNEARSC